MACVCRRYNACSDWLIVIELQGIIYHLLTEGEVITGKSQTEALMYWPSDSEVNTSRPRSEISL